jgi:EpsI family protein
MKQPIPLKNVLLCLAMIIAAGLAAAAKPTSKIADAGPKVVLEELVPKAFGEWRVDASIIPVQPSPDVQQKLDRIYNQTLARTYIDPKGRRIMLSIAYGGDQSDSTQVHRPEICYAAQGFQILNELKGVLNTSFGVLPVKRVLAQQGGRVEPITYWITVGDQITHPGFRQKLIQLTYGLSGKVPDGMLVRVSSIDRNEASGYALQEGFVRDMIAALSDTQRQRLIGVSL